MSLFTRRKVIGMFRLVGLAAPFKFSPLLAAETQASTNTPDVHLLSQDARPPASVPLLDARLGAPASDRPISDSKLPNVNWVRGNEARAEWTWAAQLTDGSPEAVPNNLGRYLVQIPGVLEKQLDYSTSLIFDTPSFRNGVQVSGFVDRVTKELVTNAIAQRRRAWYTMTHHAFLGMQSARRYGTPPEKMAQKMLHLDAPSTPGIFDRHESAALIFANKFATDPQSYSDQDFAEFRAAFGEYNQSVFADVERPFLQLRAAREARAQALVDAKSANEADTLARRAADSVPTTMPKDLLARKINSQFVELCFHSMQFVGLAGVFSALNIPDEGPMDGALQPAYPPEFIKKLNGLLAAGSNGIGEIVPPAVVPPTEAIAAGRVKVGPAPLKGARIPLASYELNRDRDFGITQGGQSLAAWGWGRGAHQPGSLVSALQHLPDADARVGDERMRRPVVGLERQALLAGIGAIVAFGIGALLSEGIGDTIRVSLTDEPVKEVEVGKEILRSLGLATRNVELIACPTCGRLEVDLFAIMRELERRLEGIKKPVKISSPRPMAVTRINSGISRGATSKEMIPLPVTRLLPRLVLPRR